MSVSEKGPFPPPSRQHLAARLLGSKRGDRLQRLLSPEKAALEIGMIVIYELQCSKKAYTYSDISTIQFFFNCTSVYKALFLSQVRRQVLIAVRLLQVASSFHEDVSIPPRIPFWCCITYHSSDSYLEKNRNGTVSVKDRARAV